MCREITKKHEEIIRGTIEEVLTVVNGLKGEMVIVVEGDKQLQEVVFELSINEQIEQYIQDGLTSKEAIKKVAKEKEVLLKNEVYKSYHLRLDNS